MINPNLRRAASLLIGLVASTLMFSGTAAAAQKADDGGGTNTNAGDGSVKCPKGEQAYQGQCFGTMGGNNGGNNTPSGG